MMFEREYKEFLKRQEYAINAAQGKLLVDRQKLLDSLCRDKNGKFINGNTKIPQKKVRDAIQNADPVKAREIKKSRWLNGYYPDEAICQRCRREVRASHDMGNSPEKYRFYPWCGSEMR